jgi:hypothetical protein
MKYGTLGTNGFFIKLPFLSNMGMLKAPKPLPLLTNCGTTRFL